MNALEVSGLSRPLRDFRLQSAGFPGDSVRELKS